ncbi:FecR domain-containing protein [uncultured Cyclobacterium sp.]|uniref:FecR family protein n=1 Tax=uncultured Cyclobacterium sp. TaxID=453820 RepID=UPI0030EC195C|tara:strand:+ start:19960 stop:20988 length:1029 start_codon:yes stop_codon:yes gene_type:complete
MDNFKKKWQDFHDGNLSKKEAVEFLHFLESDLGRANFQKLLELTWRDQDEKKSTIDNPTASPYSSKLNSKATQKKKHDFFNKFSILKISNFKIFIKYAACLFALILVLKHLDILPGITGQISKESAEPVWISKSNPKGVKSKILLPDSSWVYLNAGSQIQYPENFIENRYVYLKGEAFFEVFEDKEHPFIVEAFHVKTQVLGTSFNINSLDQESVEIGLATGSLRIMDSSSGKELLLAPGEGSKIIPSNDDIEKYKIDPEVISVWKEGILHFENENFERAIKKLENWYGVQITVKGKIPKGTCNGTFQKNTYLSNVLKVLGHALDFKSEIDKNQVIINTKSE